MQLVKVKVPGKVIVSGEHAVVYGQPAIIASVSLFMEVEIRPATRFTLKSEREDNLGLVRHTLETIGVDPETVAVSIRSQIPFRMGTSAALCAGVIQATNRLQKKKLTKRDWFELTWKCEKKAHWNSSGGDPAAVVYGGLIWYVRGRELESWRPARPYTMVLVDSGNPVESTGEMVSALAERIKIYDLRFKKLITEVGKVSINLREVMGKGGEIRELINTNGLLLEKLGLVGEKAKDMSNKLRDMGYGVKISGAGGVKAGSGRLLVVGAELDAIKNLGSEAFEVKLGA